MIFFWTLRKWVDASVFSSTSIPLSLYSLAPLLLKLPRSLGLMKIFVVIFLNIRKFWLYLCFVFQANISKFATTSIIMYCASLPHKNIVLHSNWMKLTQIWVHVYQSYFLFWLVLLLWMAREVIHSQKRRHFWKDFVFN